MLLAVDIGNTEITFGLFEGERVALQRRLTTVANRTPDEWAASLTSHFVQAGQVTGRVSAAVVASVAPAVTGELGAGIRLACEVDPVEIGPDTDLPVTLDVDDPMSVGADRVVNTLAAFRLFHHDTIVVDFGTATTFDCITADGRFLGGVIAPGLRTAADNLIRRTAKLPATELAPPARVIGRRTEECIQAGVIYGAVDAVDGIVRRIKAEWPGEQAPTVVATGGLATHVATLSVEIARVELQLTLTGLRFAAEHLGLTR